jgi:hypothetical protein
MKRCTRMWNTYVRNRLSVTLLISWSYVQCKIMLRRWQVNEWVRSTARTILTNSLKTCPTATWQQPIPHGLHWDWTGTPRWVPSDIAQSLFVFKFHYFQINLTYCINTLVVTKLLVVLAIHCSVAACLLIHTNSSNVSNNFVLCTIYYAPFFEENCRLFVLSIKLGP